MTFIFSGNGMSRQVADWIGEIPGTVGFVLPVYGWRLPKLVRRELLARRAEFAAEGVYAWAVFTCGDSAGLVDRDLERTIGRPLDAAYTVIMPETYVGLPGFRLDPPDVRAAKLAAAKTRCGEVRAALRAHTAGRDLTRGPFPFVLSKVIGPIFERFLVTDRYFHVDGAKCLKCGRCWTSCPAQAIVKGVEGLPRWVGQGTCTGCLRCYHACPGDAIEFGRFTRGKGRLHAVPQDGILLDR